MTEEPTAVPPDKIPLPRRLDDSTYGPVAVERIDPAGLALSGRDNYGRPAQWFADDIAAMDDRQFTDETASVIYQSARTQNRQFADWHWQAHACYWEARRRGNLDLYQEAYDQARASAGL